MYTWSPTATNVRIAATVTPSNKAQSSTSKLPDQKIPENVVTIIRTDRDNEFQKV